jgi:AcrR family transcriptional regulator
VGDGLRERKKERTREALETAAIELFDEHGYDATTVDQIAERAQVSTRTFFRYYPTKADVLLRDQVERLAKVQAFLSDRPSSEPIMTSLRSLMVMLAADVQPSRPLLVAQRRWSESSDMVLAAIRNHHADVVDVVTEFLHARLDAPDPLGGRARAIASACVASMVAVMLDWTEPGKEEAAGPDVDAAIAGIESALVVPG